MRSLEKAAFVDELKSGELHDHSTLYCDDAPLKLDMAAVLADPAEDSRVYVSGPAGFIDFVLGSAKSIGWPTGNLHREYLSAAPGAETHSGSFQIRFARTGQTLTIAPDVSVATVLAEHGIEIPMSCEQGLCGTCVTRVLEGGGRIIGIFI